jgi:hypothetical protein
MVTLSPNLSITLSQQRWSCVLDPNLFLSHYGLLVVKSLGKTLELWVARELWHILDNPDFYGKPSELAISPTEPGQSPELQTVKKMQVLKDWEALRAETLPVDLNLFWIGDRPGESFLPQGTEPQIMARWEGLARSLDQRWPALATSGSMLASAFRDTTALAAVLGSAFILTYQPSEESDQINGPPEICQVLEQWGIPCRQLDALDPIAVLERASLLQLIIPTGLAKLLWAGLRLIVLHLVVPSTLIIGSNAQPPEMLYSLDEESAPDGSRLNIWEGTQGFWYRL